MPPDEVPPAPTSAEALADPAPSAEAPEEVCALGSALSPSLFNFN